MSELKEKIEELKTKKNLANYNDSYSYKCALDDVLALSELQEVIEKASHFDRLFESLVVEERCPDMCRSELAFSNCIKCNGTGVISRPLTEEEKMKTAEKLIKQGWNRDYKGYYILLSSGTRVVRGNE